jgi:tRNA (cytidine/uridine-2'-O-)-methyltransferase
VNVVLVEPEIPPNTGNISRTCAVTGTTLHLVRPLGFDIGDAAVRRAGLDYWDALDLRVHDSIEAFLATHGHARLWFFEPQGTRRYDRVAYKPDDFLVYGKETAGLPSWLLARCPDQCLRVPMLKNHRSINLGSAVALTLYEALRQHNFMNLI